MYSNYSNSTKEETMFIKTDIVVIGAGCAGLECASNLYTAGLKNLVVLEAQDYLGGRIKTTLIDGDENYPLEMGANWIHGYLGNPIYRLVRENPTLFQHKKKKLFSTDVIYCVDEMGRQYPAHLYETMWRDYDLWNIEAKSVWANDKKTPFKSYTEFMVNKLEVQMKEQNLDEELKKVKRAIMERFLKQETTESGCSTMDLCSLNEYGSYLKPFGPDFEFPGGYSKLIKYQADKLPEFSIKLSHPVKHIRVLDHCSDDQNILVECFNGAMYQTKHVIVTTSVNYLQKHYSTLFHPALLSQKKVEAINTVKMGTVDKIFLFYDDMSFFPNADAIHPILLDEKNPSNSNIKVNWHNKVFTFDKFYENMLLVWITGDEANYVETLPNEEISEVLTNLLKKLLKTENVPKPKKVVKTMWNSNPYVLGSYSYVDVNGSAIKHINDLAEPIYVNNVPKILFAGEATHLRYYSTVHGAYCSGQREAKRLMDFYLNKKLENLAFYNKSKI